MSSIYGEDKVLLFGGFDSKKGVNDTWVYDLSEDNWTNKTTDLAPYSRAGHVMTSIYGTKKVLSFGGDIQGGSIANDIWIYDLINNTWTEKKPPFPKPETGSNSAMANIGKTDKLVIFGGVGHSGYSDETWIYDLSDNKWTKMNPTNKPPVRSNHAMAKINNTNKVGIFGGRFVTTVINKLDDTWIYNFNENNWKEETPINKPTKRADYTLTSLNGTDTLIMFGGIDQNNQYKNDIWNFYPYSHLESGTFISNQFDTGSESSFKKLELDYGIGSNTRIRLQIRTSKSNINLENKRFVGPSGTINSYYTKSNNTIWSGHNGDRWIQCKVYFYTDKVQKTPILRNITIVYNRWPKTNLLTPYNNSWLNISKPTFKWSFYDPDSEYQTSFQVLISDNKIFKNIRYDSGKQNTDTKYWSFPYGTSHTNLPDGIWYWKVRTKDSDDDWGQYSNYSTIKIDTIVEKPRFITVTPNTWSNRNAFIINWTYPDDFYGIKEGTYFYIGNRPPTSQSDGTWSAKKPLYLNNINEGTNNLYLWLEDKLKNKNYLKYNSTVLKLDFTSPKDLEISINNNSDFTNNVTVNIDIKAKDNLSGLNKMSFNYYKDEWTDWEAYSNSKSIILPMIDGMKRIYFRVNDKAGNIAQGSNSIILDTHSPHSLTILINNGALMTNSTDIILNLIAQDDTSGVNLSSYSFDNKTWTEWEPFENKKFYSLPSTNEGTYTIYFRVMDKASNIAKPVFASIILNLTVPIIDSDEDGHPDINDAFPNDPTQWFDSDGDKYGDNLNGNNPDYYPNDPTEWDVEVEPPDKNKPKDRDDSNLGWLIAGVVIIIVIIVIILLFLLLINRKKKAEITLQMRPPIQPQQQYIQPPILSQQNLCITCGQQKTYIQQNNGYYCYYCQKYE
jgi:hypothetical protein